MRTIAAREITRRGISAVDDDLKDGPVHVIRNDRPSYVILDEDQYRELIEAAETAAIARIKAGLEDVQAGRARPITAQELIDELDLEP